MKQGLMSFWTVLASIILTVGCGSHEPGSAVVPSQDSTAVQQSNGTNRYIWGVWEISISEDWSDVEIVPIRVGEMHLNVVRLIEVNPCTDCLKISNIHVVQPNVLEADVTLTHPYPGLIKFTGFDVRGIFVSEGNFTFPASGRKIAWGTDVPVVLNADGYTELFNPTEFPPRDPPALGYIAGKYATGGDLTATLNPFWAHRRDAPRRMFEAGGSETRTIRLYAPTGPIHFSYAVDACWQLVDDVVDPLTDFPPDANCLDAYQISIDIPYDVNSSWMSQNPISVEVFDHQGLDTISTVTIEAPDLFSGEIPLAFSTQTSEESWLFSGHIRNETEAIHGVYPLLVRVRDTESDQNVGEIDGWCLGMARVKEGWARTWGGTNSDIGSSIAIDALGNIYVTGHFMKTIDFNPGSGVDSYASNGHGDAFLSKFNSYGQFCWVRTWGGIGFDQGLGIATDQSGNVYVTGNFQGTVDFDPGAGADSHTSHGISDAFLSKFDCTGAFGWAGTWGGNNSDFEDGDLGRDVAIDASGNVYVTGDFVRTTDFDPGSGEDNHISNGNSDIFLSKFDSTGIFNWAYTWGGDSSDIGGGIAVDGSGNVFVAGFFQGSVDFDPSSGADYHASNGGDDVFLSKFDYVGTFDWARTWGGSDDDYGSDNDVDESGNVYVTGSFRGTVDFDPGIGEDNHTSDERDDVFLSKVDTEGAFIWARTWGGSHTIGGWDIALDGSGNVYVTGLFWGTLDFDPGIGEDSRISNGESDVFLSQFDLSGSYNWALTWGGKYKGFMDIGWGVATDGSGNVYVTGQFSDAADFDPGPSIENHQAYDINAFLSKFLPDGTW